MQPNDLIYLVIMIIAAGMIVYGALVPLAFLMWVGIALAVVFGVVWVTTIIRRHGAQSW